MQILFDNANTTYLAQTAKKSASEIQNTVVNELSTAHDLTLNDQIHCDSFIHCDNNNDKTGIYSSNDILGKTAKNNLTTSEVMNVQLTSTSSTNVYYDTIKAAAAKKAAVTLSSSGSPNINSGYEAKRYSDEISRINNCFYCQTGGWSALSGDGSSECCRTAVATMASINSGYTVTPNNTTGNSNGLTGMNVNGKNVTLTKASKQYNITSGPASGLNMYSCGSEEGVVDAINNELSNGRSVLVKTTVGGEHWVTVTGTLNGKPAGTFEDFVGVDPWYNGNNPGNMSTGTGSYSTNPSRAGVIQLSDVKNQNLHSNYSIVTYKP